MKKAIYPGSFDPMTKGHIDIVKKAIKVYDIIYVVIAVNPDKNHMFSIEDRFIMANRSLVDLNVPEGKEIILISYKGVISKLAMELNVEAIIRGMRNAHDMQDEYAIEQFTEQTTEGNVVTTYFSPSPEHIFTSSTLVRNFIKGGFFSKAKNYMDKNAYTLLEACVQEGNIEKIQEDTTYKLHSLKK